MGIDIVCHFNIKILKDIFIPLHSCSAKTCAKLNVTIEKPWDEDYENKSSETYKDTYKKFSSAVSRLIIAYMHS